jgi:lipoteichoic acid synthase
MTQSFKDTFHGFFALFPAFAVSFLLIRVYEALIVAGGHILPADYPVLFLTGLLADLSLLAVFGLGLFLLYTLARIAGETAAAVTFYLISGVVLILYVVLVQYFAEVLVPLGRDFFAYSPAEISDTVNTSIDIGFLRILPLIVFPALVYPLSLLFRRISGTAWFQGGVMIWLFCGFFIWLFFYPASTSYLSESKYNLVVNKAGFFGEEATLHIVSGTLRPARLPEFTGSEYPMLKPAQYEDVLGPFIETAERPPTIVMILVEGLGGTFMGDRARYAGFTPFLDSLRATGLFWDHFLSMSGRSFGAVPSITGSLPYGRNGFLELGNNMPNHHSLISLLNQNDYHTAYFCGYNSSFDKLDIFLERNDIDLLMDASRFTSDYARMDETADGFTWGYADHDVFTRAFDFIDYLDYERPRLDIYFTLNFHEPFIVPDQEKWLVRFRQKLGTMNPDPELRRELENYESIFAALLYTDDAIRRLIAEYQKRPGFQETIFIISGDHRIAPIPHATRIDRFHVPFMIWSPLVKDARTMSSVSTFMNVAPTLLGHLSEAYNLILPDSTHWMGGVIDTVQSFRSVHEMPFMRNKDQLVDYMYKNLFLADDQLFRITEGMDLERVDDAELMQSMQRWLLDFKSKNDYVTAENKLLPADSRFIEERGIMLARDAAIDSLGYGDLSNEQLYFAARELAQKSEYDVARLLLGKALQRAPNFHDARILLARTHAWDGDYITAETHIQDVIRRNEHYYDSWAALSDLAFWRGDHEESLSFALQGIQHNRDNTELLFRKARAQFNLGNISEARSTISEVLRLNPSHEDAQQLNRRMGS